MSGICSRHRDYRADCRLCNTDVRDVLPGYDERVREAEEAGLVTCGACGFEFYRTIEFCPACEGWTWLDGGYWITWPFHGEDERGGDPAWIGRFERRT